MKMFNRIAIAAALVAPMAIAAPASAQSWKWDLGATAGYSRFTKSVDSDSLGALASNPNAPELAFENKVRFGGQLRFWLSPKFALRANGKYSDNSVRDAVNEVKVIEPVNLWHTTGDLLFRFKAPNETFSGSEFLPYFALGLGATWAHHAGGPVDTCNDTGNGKSWNCLGFNVNGGTPPKNTVVLSKDKDLTGLVGLGADWRLAKHLSLTMEVNDYIFKPQFIHATQTNATTFTFAENDRISKWTNEFGADLGLHLLFGLKAPPVVAVAPAPAPPPPPPPPPAPAPAPPAPPREDQIQVCVIDPSQTNGLRMQNAIYMPSSGDTMVVMNGNRVRFSQSLGNVMTVRNADWYVAGKPLEITINKDKMSYGTEGGAVMIESGKLAYLGTVNGYPVYANRDDVADVASKVAAARAADASRDLGAIIAADKALRGEMEDVKYLYVPLQPTGCVFQAFHYMEPVKKGK